jgi:hypothetical protein
MKKNPSFFNNNSTDAATAIRVCAVPIRQDELAVADDDDSCRRGVLRLAHGGRSGPVAIIARTISPHIVDNNNNNNFPQQRVQPCTHIATALGADGSNSCHHGRWKANANESIHD